VDFGSGKDYDPEGELWSDEKTSSWGEKENERLPLKEYGGGGTQLGENLRGGGPGDAALGTKLSPWYRILPGKKRGAAI